MIYDFSKGNSRARIICAACKTGHIILCSARHWDKIMNIQYDLLPPEKPKGSAFKQGFIDQFGNFYNRVEALETVIRNSIQSIDYERNGNNKELYSEGLY